MKYTNEQGLSDARQALKRRLSSSGLSLDESAVTALDAYYVLLAHWTKRINLTSLPLDAPTEATFDRLFIEPLLAAERFLSDDTVWFDIGSGGGSPAIPMKVIRRKSSLTMVESRIRKAAFLREVVRELMLIDVTVAESRSEELRKRASLAAVADTITVRALRADSVLFGTAEHLLKAGGCLIVFGQVGAPAKGFERPKPIALSPTSTVQVFRKIDVPRGTNRLT